MITIVERGGMSENMKKMRDAARDNILVADKLAKWKINPFRLHLCRQVYCTY